MKDQIYTQPDALSEILALSSRLRYVLKEKYNLTESVITSIRVDSDNFKIDVRAGEEHLRFKAKGTDTVLMHDPDSGILKATLDPALAQGIYEICSESFATA